MVGHSIKNPQIIHMMEGGSYLCNRACSVTPTKWTTVWKEVTCKNCERLLEKEARR